MKSKVLANERIKEGTYPFCEGCTISCYLDPSFHFKLDRYFAMSILSKAEYVFWKKIVQTLCSLFLKEQNTLRNLGAGYNSPGRPPTSGVTYFSSMIGVSRKAVSRWLNGEMQSSNVNAERLLNIAAEFIPETLEKILLEDLERHKLEVEA